jgi:hypothetical protein
MSQTACASTVLSRVYVDGVDAQQPAQNAKALRVAHLCPPRHGVKVFVGRAFEPVRFQGTRTRRSIPRRINHAPRG